MLFAWSFMCAIQAISLSWRSETTSSNKIRPVRYYADGVNPTSDFGESEYPEYAYEFEYF